MTPPLEKIEMKGGAVAGVRTAERKNVSGLDMSLAMPAR